MKHTHGSLIADKGNVPLVLDFCMHTQERAPLKFIAAIAKEIQYDARALNEEWITVIGNELVEDAQKIQDRLLSLIEHDWQERKIIVVFEKSIDVHIAVTVAFTLGASGIESPQFFYKE